MDFEGYDITEIISENKKFIFHRGLRKKDKQPVILKTFSKIVGSPDRSDELKHEYDLLKNRGAQIALPPIGLEQIGNDLVLVLNDIGGQSLRTYLNKKKQDLQTFLIIALGLSKIINLLHQKGIIHKNIQPDNLIFNSKTGQVRVMDFGLTSVRSKENSHLEIFANLKESLPYISPEQTGRMNRATDYRSDLYTMAIIYYEILTGSLPFKSIDPLEIVHCHIAKQPVPPHEKDSQVPKVVSSIIMKLLSKDPEDRYNSSMGLTLDLQKCLDMMSGTGKIDKFDIAQNDISNRLQIPQTLYGRKVEINILLDAFDRASHGNMEMILVAGYSGVGKSSLVYEVQKTIVQKRGYFISGKFDQFKRNIPYASLIDAFTELIQKILSERASQIDQWRQRIQSALGANGKIITDVIPELELIIGQQQPVAKLPSIESSNRFIHVFQRFIRTFASKKHPLIIFLDDLQWADQSSLRLIEVFMKGVQVQCILIIGAYRDNEVGPLHQLEYTLNHIKEHGTVVNRIVLKPLNQNTIGQMLSETLYCSREKVKPLAKLFRQKTNGNPFFIFYS